MTGSAPQKRPGLITLIGLVIWIQAIISAVVAVSTLILRNDADYQALVGKSADDLLIRAIIEAVLALVLVLVARGIMSGSPGARTAVAAVMAVRVGYGIFSMITSDGGYVAVAAISIAIAMWVLWALYDREESRAYFAG